LRSAFAAIRCALSASSINWCMPKKLWNWPLNRTIDAWLPFSTIRAPYASPSSRSGSYWAVMMSAGGRSRNSASGEKSGEASSSRCCDTSGT
jgi:hypothetical protein